MLYDTHAHINLWKLPLREKEIIKNLKDSWVKLLNNIWTDLETSKDSINLAKKYDFIYASVWVHPTEIKKYDDIDGTIKKLEEMILENRDLIIWVWETWLDYYWIDKNNFDKEKKLQEKWFKAQINLAKKYELPIIIHNRDAKYDTLRILKETDMKKFVLHCFSENLDFAYKALYFSDECIISFSWIVTYKNAKNIAMTAANIDLSKIMIETDCPYLAPQKLRGEENQPANVKYVLDKIFELRQENDKNENYEEVEKQIFQNSLEFFWVKS